MVMDTVLEKREEIFGSERGFEVGFHELVQLVLGNRCEVVSATH